MISNTQSTTEPKTGVISGINGPVMTGRPSRSMRKPAAYAPANWYTERGHRYPLP